MAALILNAAYASVVEDEGMLFVGFAEGEAEDEGYALFRQPIEGGPVWFEVNDESFGVEDAIGTVQALPEGIEITLRPGMASRFGWASAVTILIDPDAEGRDAAYEALDLMLGADLAQ
ncbi:MAG: hypothetical protein HC844_01420 [Tabrizicola sp.]|nr:hypothetical protein [Tabrizicola sp.]